MSTQAELGERAPKSNENLPLVWFYESLSRQIGSLNDPRIGIDGFDLFCAQKVKKAVREGVSDFSNISPFLTAEDTAKFLKVDYKTVLRAIARRELPFIRVGGQYRISGLMLYLFCLVQEGASTIKDDLLRRGAVQNADLRLISGDSTPGSLSQIWEDYVKKAIGSVKQGYSLEELAQKSLLPVEAKI